MPPPPDIKAAEEEFYKRLRAMVECQHGQMSALNEKMETQDETTKTIMCTTETLNKRLQMPEARHDHETACLLAEIKECQVENVERAKKMKQLSQYMKVNFQRAAEDIHKLQVQMVGCQKDNVDLAKQVADLTNIVGQLMYRMDMQEGRVKKEEEEGKGGVTKEEAVA
jgi:archaellum component FlaC